MAFTRRTRSSESFCSALCDLAGHRLGARQKVWEGHCRYRGSGRLAVPVCCSAGNVPAAYAEADCQHRAGVCHHQPGAHVDQHHGRGYLVSGVLLYLLRNHRKSTGSCVGTEQLLWDFVLVYLQLRGQPGFELSQMFTTYYEWFGVAAAVLMLAYNGMHGSEHKRCFIGSTRPMSTCCMRC